LAKFKRELLQLGGKGGGGGAGEGKSMIVDHRPSHAL
jgi:hypothetical protein